jgi:zinc transport system substrate-binding protein
MKKQIIGWVGSIVIIVVVGYAIAHRIEQQNKGVADTDRMQVVASFYPLAHLAQEIGKERVEVLNLTPPGSEPHDFDPSPRDIATLQNSKVFIYNGAGLEPWVERIIPELEQKGVRIVEASQGLDLLAAASHEDEGKQEGEKESFDPHIWLDPVLMKAEVNTIASVFVAVDPTGAPEYMANARAYTEELEKLDAEFVEGLKQCKRHDIVTSHAAFAYLANRYGLHMISISGLSPEEEPSPARLGEVARFVQEKGVTHIFFETLVSPKLAETLARETGAQTISFNPLEGLSGEEISQGKNYLTVQRENLQALRTALDCL